MDWQQWRRKQREQLTEAVLGLSILAGLGIVGYVVWTVVSPLLPLLAAGLDALSDKAELSRPMTRGDGLIVGIVLYLAIWAASRERDR